MSTSDSASSLRFVGPLALAGLLVFAGLCSLGAQVHFSRTADAEDWAQAAKMAVQIAEPTDAIRVHPSWTETPLPHLRPVGNLLHRQHYPLLEDTVGIERFLIITETNRRDEALHRLPVALPPQAVEDFDTVQLLVVPVPEPLRIEGDLTEHLRGASVSYREADGGEQRCRLTGGISPVWRCEDGRIRSTMLEVEHEPRRCIQAFPPSGDRHLAVEMTVPQTSDILRIRAGLDNRAARLERGDDVEYRIFVDDSPVADERVDGHTSTWAVHEVTTSDRDGGPVQLRMEVESVASDPHHRRFCFNGWTLTEEQVQNSKR